MPKNKKKILLIEDEEAIAEMYKIKLEEEGFETIVLNKGSEAVQLAVKEKPAVVLLDVIMPELDGFSVLRELRSKSILKKTPIFLLTNLGQEADRAKGEELGASNYFVKAEHTPAQIIEAIKNFLNK